jgi:hypothetical protein
LRIDSNIACLNPLSKRRLQALSSNAIGHPIARTAEAFDGFMTNGTMPAAGEPLLPEARKGKSLHDY